MTDYRVNAETHALSVGGYVNAAMVELRGGLYGHDFAASDPVELADHERVAGMQLVEAGEPVAFAERWRSSVATKWPCR